ncbi:MAG: hypothetical protein Q8M07_20475 [Prosthecobacter sp.]|nr:hypothetical protein [Prosthecobacter sp.]
MTWTQNIAQWRSLPAERKLQIRRDAIPLDVAQSMAFEREPVEIEVIRETLATHARRTRRGSSKPDSAR